MNKLSSENKLLTDIWKEKAINTLHNIYGKLNDDVLERYLDKMIEKAPKPTMNMRNIYTHDKFPIDMNGILKTVYRNELIIGANGAYTYRQEKAGIAETSQILMDFLKDRKVEKTLAIEADAAGDKEKAAYHDNIQGRIKMFVNSFYGVQTQSGSILFSHDTGAMITAQARELISESMWTLEKFLAGNTPFFDMNEYYAYTNEILNCELDDDYIKKYEIQVPSYNDIVSRMKTLMEFNYEEDVDVVKSMSASHYLMAKQIAKDPKKAINYYYKNNLYEFLKRNPKVMDIIDWIIGERKPFMTPDLSEMAKSESVIYIEPLKELTKILSMFIVVELPTYQRVQKYIHDKRKAVIISDTDSVMAHLNPWLVNIAKLSKHNIDIRGEESDIFRIINIAAFVAGDIINKMASVLAQHCYVPEDYRWRLNLKNEFLFTSAIIYPDKKKNYSTLCRIREGKLVRKIANTGLALVGSNKNPFVKKTFDTILEEEIHTNYDVDIMRVIKRIYKMEEDIRRQVHDERRSAFGTYTSYKYLASKADTPWADSTIRGVTIWNELYPESQIVKNSKVYRLNTILEKVEQLHLIKDEKIREKVMKFVFEDPNYVRYGLRSICIPDNMEFYPEWIQSILNVNKIVEAHMNSVTNLLPSIGIYINRIKSNRKHISSLINF